MFVAFPMQRFRFEVRLHRRSSKPVNLTLLQLTRTIVVLAFWSSILHPDVTKGTELYATGWNSGAIHKFSSTGQNLGIFAHSVGRHPAALQSDSKGNLYVANTHYIPSGAEITTVQKFSPNGVDLGIVVEEADLSISSLAISRDDVLYMGTMFTGIIRRFGTDGSDLGTFANTGIWDPRGMTFDESGNLYVVNRFGHSNSITKVSAMGTTVDTFVSMPDDYNLNGLALDQNGKLYVSSASHNEIHRFGPDGADLGTFANTGLNQPIGILFDSQGYLYVANNSDDVHLANADTIHRFSPLGEDLGTFARLPSGASPVFLAFAPVPEPSPFVLVSMAAVAILTRRGKRR